MFGFFSDFSIVVLIYFKTKLIVFVLQSCFDFYKKKAHYHHHNNNVRSSFFQCGFQDHDVVSDNATNLFRQHA